MCKLVSGNTYNATLTMHYHTVYGFSVVCKYLDH